MIAKISLFVLFVINFSNGQLLPSQISCDFGSEPNPFCSYRSAPNTFLINPSLNTTPPHKIVRPLIAPPSGNFVQLNLQMARLDSAPFETPSGVICLQMDYYSFGGWGFFGLTIEGADESFQKVYEGVAGNVDRWRHLQKSIYLDAGNYSLKIEAMGSVGNVVAFSNLVVSEGACPNLPNFYCDFDSYGDDCDWLTKTGNWTITNGGTIGQDPLDDHSMRSRIGNYLRAPYLPIGSEARFTLPNRELSTGDHCFSFWSFPALKYSTKIVKVDSEGQDEILYVIAQINDRQWEYSQIDIPATNDDVILVTQMINDEGQHFNAHCFDSIRLDRGPCPKIAECDFSSTTCGLAVLGGLIGYGRVPNPTNLGPNFTPPTHGAEGSYFYFEWSAQEGFWLPRKITTPVLTSGEYCLQFEYYNLGPMERIDISTKGRTTATRYQYTMVDQLNKIDLVNRQWTTRRVSIQRNNSFTIDIEAKSLGKSFFAIRTIVIDEGACQELTTPLTPYEVNFECFKTGHFIEKYKICDGVIDCPMGEDEEVCEHHDCSSSGIPCQSGGQNFCLADSDKYCNGVADCDDAIDEDPRLCNQELLCSSRGNYCLNGGICSASRDQHGCKCDVGFNGKRCQNEQ